jgi:hypothetical protein
MKQWDMRHIGIFDINFDTGEYYWSAELRRILRVPDGMPPEFLILLQHVHPDDRPALVAFAMEPLQGRCAPHRSFEHRLLDPDGTVALGAHRSRHSFSSWQRTRRRPCNRTSHGNRRTENVGNSGRKLRVHS